jgi:hypothetical protein
MATDRSIESNIIAFHFAHVPYIKIAGRLHVGQTRRSRTLPRLHQSGIVPDALRIGRPKKMQNNLVAFIEARTVRKPSISSVEPSQEIEEQFGAPVSLHGVSSLSQRSTSYARDSKGD